MAYLAADGTAHPHLAERCSSIAAAAPLAYGLFALRFRSRSTLASATAQLDPHDVTDRPLNFGSKGSPERDASLPPRRSV